MLIKVSLFVMPLLLGCSNRKEPEQPDCNGVACTQNFVSLIITIRDASGNAVLLDSYTVIDAKSGEKLNLWGSEVEFDYLRKTGSYIIFNDSFRLQYQNATTKISFTGFISGEAIVNETFEVGADCCHVQLVSGNRNLVLD